MADRALTAEDITLQLCEPRSTAFTQAGWAFELKLDGFRLLAERINGKPRLVFRRGREATALFPEIVDALARLPGPDFILDGELVIQDEQGHPVFQRLLRRSTLASQRDIDMACRADPAVYFSFDLLMLNGEDVRARPLVERKALLFQLLPPKQSERVLPVDHIETQGEMLLDLVKKKGLEGIVAKRLDSQYRGGRGGEWLKIALTRIGDFAVVGYADDWGALYFATFDGEQFVYAGKMGSGFTPKIADSIKPILEPRRLKKAPCIGDVPREREAVWCEPVLVIEIRYKNWPDGLAPREPRFLRFRDDKAPKECATPKERSPHRATLDQLANQTHPAPVSGIRTAVARPVVTRGTQAVPTNTTGSHPAFRLATGSHSALGDGADAPTEVVGSRIVPLATGENPAFVPGAAAHDAQTGPLPEPPTEEKPSTGSHAKVTTGSFSKVSNLEKVYFPDDGLTKGDVVAWYRAVAPFMLPYLKDRPLVLTRYPDGIRGKSFFQKQKPVKAPDFVRSVVTYSEEQDKDIEQMVCDDEATLEWLANLGAIPIHIPAARVASAFRPDWATVDFDPKEAPFEHVITLANTLHRVCDEAGLPTYVKTSGSSGLHVLVPLGGQLDYPGARQLAELLATMLIARHPDLATTERMIPRRDGRVYLDTVQNADGKVVAAPFCVRPHPTAPVSMPIPWSDVVPGLTPRQFTLRTAMAILEARGDTMAPVLKQAPNFGDIISKLASLNT